MYPILINIGSISIPTYGFLIGIGFLVSLYVIKRLSIWSKLNVNTMQDLAFWCLLLGLLGSRVLYVITQFSYFLANPFEVFKVWEGRAFLGGLILALLFLIWYLKKHKINLWKAMDVLFPGLVVAHMFGRFGCFFAGCCYGRPTGTSFGIRLHPDLVNEQYQGILLHPTQLYEAGALFLLFLSLVHVFKKKVFDGQVLLTYFLTYSIIRFIIEIYRGDDLDRGFIIENVLSTSQFISILIFIAALLILLLRLRQVENGGVRV